VGLLLLAASACSGTKLNDVGDVNAGAGGAPGAGGSHDVGGAMSPVGGRGGTSGGEGGFSGSRNIQSPIGGDGGEGPIGVSDAGASGAADAPIDCPTCTLVGSDEDIRGIATDDQKVYWIDYGTNDQLGNYNSDGRLLARDLSGGSTATLNGSLPGPIAVSVSSKYVYVFVDQRTQPSHALGVMRVPLAGGAAQDIQGLEGATYSTYRVFTSAPGYEYWNWGGAVYRIAETDGATVETFLTARGVLDIQADDTLLYYQDATGVWTVPFAGGDPTPLVSTTGQAMTSLSGDYIYGVDSRYLTRVPKIGGAWKRFVDLMNASVDHFVVDGDSYVVATWLFEPNYGLREIAQGSLNNLAPPVVLASEPFGGGNAAFNGWANSSVGVFVADSNGIYLVPHAAACDGGTCD
jgi:hypothetical protein